MTAPVPPTFASASHRLLSAFIYFFGVTILTHFLSRRLCAEKLTTREAWASLSWPRLSILLILLDSYFFLLASGILIFGVGLRRDGVACAAGIYLCVGFYTTSKLLIYCFLSEKVYIVWENGVRPRLRSPVYLVCLVTIVLYIGVILAMFFGRIAEFRSGDGQCVIGLHPSASISLLAYDLYVNVLLTSLFCWPIFRVKFANARLRRLAIQNLIAAAAALSSSAVNIAILTSMNGRELGWVCLASCGADVVFNAIVLFYVTGGNRSAPSTTAVSRGGEEQISTLTRPAVSIARPASSLKPSHMRTPSYRMDSQAVPATKNSNKLRVHISTTSITDLSPPPRTSYASEQDHPIMQQRARGVSVSTTATLAAKPTDDFAVEQMKRFSGADSENTLEV
ncbi:hypothetical protein R3P38DRAFT_3098313 [Favolaschia claudopus]|uniref:Transmembrane protein n=1 Tax=Favolaschia claudopus TaxID=2862362 RepID=A0AAV9ZNM7_9AGAR